MSTPLRLSSPAGPPAEAKRDRPRWLKCPRERTPSSRTEDEPQTRLRLLQVYCTVTDVLIEVPKVPDR